MTYAPLVLLSGGMDSSTLLRYALEDANANTREDELVNALAVFVDYGQRHVRERTSAQLVALHYGVELVELDLRAFGASVRSALTSDEVAVPHGHYAEDNMAITVVPNRNAVLLMAAAGIAASRGMSAVYTAVHAGDHAVYADCRPEFIEQIGRASRLACGVDIRAPFVLTTKAGIADMGRAMGVPYHLTWSCYEGGERHCGRCGTCVERAEAFLLAGMDDPTDYADPEFFKQALLDKALER